MVFAACGGNETEQHETERKAAAGSTQTVSPDVLTPSDLGKGASGFVVDGQLIQSGFPQRPWTLDIVDKGQSGERRLLRYALRPGVQRRVLVSYFDEETETRRGLSQPDRQVSPGVRLEVATVIGDRAHGGTWQIRTRVARAERVEAPAQTRFDDVPTADMVDTGLDIVMTERGLADSVIVRTTSKLDAYTRVVLNLVPLFVLMPRDPIGIGAHWTARGLVNLGGFEAPMTITYELVDRDDDRIQLKGTVNVRGPVQLPDSRIKGTATMTQAGTFSMFIDLGSASQLGTFQSATIIDITGDDSVTRIDQLVRVGIAPL
ncbi:MAG: hypothetical protein KIT31_16375 [Deltaproteobacteria bacterium]|nr:hypothetical protein [Deltaproteobacteria bacterium]